jgi:Holliday junction DNA helicase RuvA
MINHIEGKITEKNPAYVVVDCNGVGYFLNISLNTFSKIGSTEQCRLLTHLLVREDSHTLYGFHDEKERELFRNLISVSGIGAATARMILSSLSPEEIQQAILTGNVSALKKIKGIGEKTAQQMILDLKGKMGRDETSAQPFVLIKNKTHEEALAALISLGFARNAAERVLEKVIKSGSQKTVEAIVKEALQNL